MMSVRVCRVMPDVTALERSFDYVVPDHLGELVRVGVIVRVELHGRRVRGWVVADDVVAEVDTAKLRPVLSVPSAGPPPLVVELCSATAYRYAGPVAPLLRAASPPNNVPVHAVVTRDGATAVPKLDPATDERERLADELAGRVHDERGVTVLRW